VLLCLWFEKRGPTEISYLSRATSVAGWISANSCMQCHSKQRLNWQWQCRYLDHEQTDRPSQSVNTANKSPQGVKLNNLWLKCLKYKNFTYLLDKTKWDGTPAEKSEHWKIPLFVRPKLIWLNFLSRKKRNLHYSEIFWQWNSALHV